MRLLLLLFVCIYGLLAAAAGETPRHSVRFKLLRHGPAAPEDRTDHLRQLARSDLLRQRMISDTIGRRLQRRKGCEVPPGPSNASSFAMPIGSGAYVGTGQYFVRFRVGTPAQKFLLVADTGSDLTWMNCRARPACRRCRADRNGTRVFDASASSSFKPITCSSEMCKASLPFSLSACPTPATPCAYNYGYADGSSAQGFFANESATVTLSDGRKTKLRGLVVGCTSASSGSSFSAADGVLGLGYSAVSFATRAAGLYGGRFSYCLVDHLSPHNASSYLTFGPNPALSHGSARSTALLIEPRLAPFYAVGVEGISVGGEVLKIPSSVWDASRGGGAIVDSGTSLTVLSEPAYQAVVSALSEPLSSVPKLVVPGFDYCYNWTAGGEGVAVPELVVHFNGSARLAPPAKSYLIDVSDGVKCIGVTSATWPGVSTIGNILQQEHLWEFDIENQRLRFQSSTCGGPY